MSDTPRVAALIEAWSKDPLSYVGTHAHWDLARDLERELRASTEYAENLARAAEDAVREMGHASETLTTYSPYGSGALDNVAERLATALAKNPSALITGGAIKENASLLETGTMPKRVLVGGNHLTNVLVGRLGGNFSSRFPPTMPHEQALEGIRDNETYDVWCCWAAIMRARDAGECVLQSGTKSPDALPLLGAAIRAVIAQQRGHMVCYYGTWVQIQSGADKGTEVADLWIALEEAGLEVDALVAIPAPMNAPSERQRIANFQSAMDEEIDP